MKISLCLDTFYCWKEPFGVNARLNFLEIVKDLDLDGIELHFSEQELLDEEFNKFKDKLDNYLVTFHMPKLTKKPEQIFDSVKKMIPLLNIKRVVIHADQWDELEEKPDDIPFVIENSDKNKSGFQDLKDVIKFKKDICLDINHLEETMPGKIQEQIGIAKELIKEIHVSSLKNPLYKEFPISSSHYLVYGSGYNIPDTLPRDIVWVIEGVIPKDRLDLLEKEIELLRNL